MNAIVLVCFPGDKQVAVDEFAHFISDDFCDLVNVVEHYEQLDENSLGAAQKGKTGPEFLAEIHKMQVPPELYERMKSLRAIRSERPSALTPGKKRKKHLKKHQKKIEKQQKEHHEQVDYHQGLSDDEEKGQVGVNPIEMETLEGSTINQEQMGGQM